MNGVGTTQELLRNMKSEGIQNRYRTITYKNPFVATLSSLIPSSRERFDDDLRHYADATTGYYNPPAIS